MRKINVAFLLVLMAGFFLGASVADAKVKVTHRITIYKPLCYPNRVITVTNNTTISATALLKVERAASDQSLQEHRAWGTPCVQFANHGWPLALSTGCTTNPDGSTACQLGGYHNGTNYPYHPTGQPTILVQTGLSPMWTVAFTHEIVETLENPTASLAIGAPPEIADPVSKATYLLDGVRVSNFAFPAFYNHSSTGPYDQMNTLTQGM